MPRTNAQTFRRRFLLSGLLAFEEYLKISHKVGVHIAGVNFQTRFKVNDLQHIFYRPRKSEIGERGRGGTRRSRASAEAGGDPLLTERLPGGSGEGPHVLSLRSTELRKHKAFGANCSGACFKASRRLSFSSCRSRPEPTHRPSAGAFSFRPPPSPLLFENFPRPIDIWREILYT